MDAYQKGFIKMSNDFYLSVGIDVGADFSFMSIALPNQTFVGKPFKIIHGNPASLEKAVLTIKEAEESNSLKARIFLESTGIYHYPLFCYLRDKGFTICVINPIITKSSTNINIRKVHNDKFDSKKLALVALKPDLKVSIIPSDLVLDLRNLTREYYNLMDQRSAYVNKLQGELRMAFPGYIGIFSKLTVETSLALLEKYALPADFLAARKKDIVGIISSTACFGAAYAEKQYGAIIAAAQAALVFGHALPSNGKLIKLYVSFIKKYNVEVGGVLAAMHELVDAHPDELFIKQIHLIETFKGAGFLSAVTVMCEIGDFSVFKSPKQLFAYFGLDPAVKQSGKFTGTHVKMSKRGSPLARRVIHTMALVGIGRTRKGTPNNSVLRDYYLSKCQSKPKMVALGAVMHKVCNIVFAILRDEKPFAVITPSQHKQSYLQNRCPAA